MSTLPTSVLQLDMTHAHLNKALFDEVQDEITSSGGWIFARQGDAYGSAKKTFFENCLMGWKMSSCSVGLFTNNEAIFVPEDGGVERDLVATGVQNVWICEVGSLQNNGTFEEFTASLRDSQVKKPLDDR